MLLRIDVFPITGQICNYYRHQMNVFRNPKQLKVLLRAWSAVQISNILTCGSTLSGCRGLRVNLFVLGYNNVFGIMSRWAMILITKREKSAVRYLLSCLATYTL